ncbi:MAG: DUF192 domain-containing protein [Pseudomonadota bacterium]|nr:DUF192 domain-containing protein [Pseudomonadota bacterium]
MMITGLFRRAVLAAVIGSVAPTIASADTSTCTVKSLSIETRKGAVSVSIEVATTPETRELGLMNRTQLAPDAGMLFVYPPDRAIAFWMKNTLIPLDMLFIDGAGGIQFIKHEAQPHDLTPIPGPTGIAARAALEINGGRAEELGIEVGDRIRPIWAEEGMGCEGS